jgi:putative PLP-dependent aminotransferase (TIGR04422 family)
MEREIESFFESRLGHHAVVMPSARAALSLILKTHGFARSHVIFAPLWTSHCVWDVLGRYSNPTVGFDPAPDGFLAVHKWGYVHRFENTPRGLIIEDSVDSLVASGDSLFPNGGLYELFSLPKIMGTFCGGIVLTRRRALAARLRSHRQNVAASFAARQTDLKYACVRSNGTRGTEWQCVEYLNTRLDPNGLEHVLQCIGNYDINAKTIQRRLESVVKTAPRLARQLDPRRLPPVLPVAVRSRPRRAANSSIMIRRFDFSRRIDLPRYEPAYLLPLHFGVPDAQFQRTLAFLR